IRRQRPALGLLQFTDACTNGRRRQVRCLSHGTHPSPTEFQGLTGCPQTPRPFIERAREPPKLPANPGNNLSILHARVMPDPPNWHKGKFDKLFFPNLLGVPVPCARGPKVARFARRTIIQWTARKLRQL